LSGGEDPGASGGDLLDLPLRGERVDSFALPLASEGPPVDPPAPSAAPPSARIVAAASDAAVLVLVVSAAVLVAGSIRGLWPAAAGILWAAAFALYLSFFATVVPLILFGRTVGMALAGLAAAPRGGSRRLELRESVLRWTGSLVTALSLGLSLLFTRRDRQAPTLADALSGRPLLRSENPSTEVS
jgi:uncharacterized RDD family membrane protein YckC